MIETVLVRAELTGTVVAVTAEAGSRVPEGALVVVLESMKMEHMHRAPAGGTVHEVLVRVGQLVEVGTPLATIHPGEVTAVPEQADPGPAAVRPDLAEALTRRAAILDGGRPEAVAARHAQGRRTTRENIAELCDPGTFTEYGGLAVAAQRQRRDLVELRERTPADGIVTGIGRVHGQRVAVLAYDYTVLAGTQGLLSHRKTDRLLELAHRDRLPVVVFAEGGGGRPGDTDTTAVSGLDVPTFALMGGLSGLVPTVAIVSGYCFAGNAALAGCADVLIATPEASIGMGGPAMIEGGGLGTVAPREVGPLSVQVPNGVVDVAVADEAQAVRTARQYLSYFQGRTEPGPHADQALLRDVLPEQRKRAYDVRAVIDLLADEGSVLELRPHYGPGLRTCLARIEGRAFGIIANDSRVLGGAIDAPGADTLARFLRLCQDHGLPVLSLCDTPGFLVGPEAEATGTVRAFSQLFVLGARLTVPVVCVVLRKAYGLGAQAMAGGHLRVPVATVAWPSGELGAMGLEGAVRLAHRRELAAIADQHERTARYERLLATARQDSAALNIASVFEIDDVIDPADTRAWLAAVLS
ncbi:acetyl-CoA carboxylase carboxyltransferase component [Crossiella equi]|uniref:Acetyl-CoA carboxylase carboxyltransferase component n=1 Tax=Crossiella equi TaxID=130796 RepID=A0ABS5AQN0_9PSEU|nr:carboxyl transferase domain-containing protein [Crossiella equi]MBP2478879.1 acetyl-CoA carboxylase carboxyltransferase component [Crossiella equi]